MGDWPGRVDTNEKLMATGSTMVFYQGVIPSPVDALPAAIAGLIGSGLKLCNWSVFRRPTAASVTSCFGFAGGAPTAPRRNLLKSLPPNITAYIIMPRISAMI
jgi:hypothetical protein